jgi:hypothetical protein
MRPKSSEAARRTLTEHAHAYPHRHASQYGDNAAEDIGDGYSAVIDVAVVARVCGNRSPRPATVVSSTGWWTMFTHLSLTASDYHEVLFSGAGPGVSDGLLPCFVNSPAITIPATLFPRPSPPPTTPLLRTAAGGPSPGRRAAIRAALLQVLTAKFMTA